MCHELTVSVTRRWYSKQQTDRQTDVTEYPDHAAGYAGVGNNSTADWVGLSTILTQEFYVQIVVCRLVRYAPLETRHVE